MAVVRNHLIPPPSDLNLHFHVRNAAIAITSAERQAWCPASSLVLWRGSTYHFSLASLFDKTGIGLPGSLSALSRLRTTIAAPEPSKFPCYHSPCR